MWRFPVPEGVKQETGWEEKEGGFGLGGRTPETRHFSFRSFFFVLHDGRCYGRALFGMLSRSRVFFFLFASDMFMCVGKESGGEEVRRTKVIRKT